VGFFDDAESKDTLSAGRNADQVVDCGQQSAGASGLRILHALTSGETDPKKLAQLGGERLQCTEEQLLDTLTGRVQSGAWGDVGLAARAAPVDRCANDSAQ
jgi:hypothetical protein